MVEKDSGNDVQEVEIVEPVEVHRVNGSLQAYRWAIAGYVCLALGVCAGLFFGFSNDNNLEQEIYNRCQISERIIGILRVEHIHALDEAQAELRETKQFRRAHPRGTRDFSIALINRSVKRANARVGREQVIIRNTKPTTCRK